MNRIIKKNLLIKAFIILFFNIGHYVHAQNPIILLAGDAKYIKIHMSENNAIETGNLWDLGIYRIYDGIIDYSKKRLYIKSDYAVFVVDYCKMTLLKKIEAPFSSQDLLNFFISSDGGEFVVSVFDTDTGKVITTLYETREFDKINTLPCDAVSKSSHFIGSEHIVCIETINKKRMITIINTEECVIEKSIPFNFIAKGAGMNGRLVDVDSRNGKILLLNASYDKIKNKRLFIYDILTGKSTDAFELSFDGIHGFLGDSNLVFTDEVEYQTIEVGLNKKSKAGVIHFYDFESSKEIPVVKYPPAGKIIGFSQNEQRLYLFHDWQLMEIEILSNKVKKRINLFDKIKNERSNKIDLKSENYTISPGMN